MRKGIALFCFLFFLFGVYSQVEVFRGSQDTGYVISPEDTITKPPQFDGGEDAFYSFLANSVNYQVLNAQLIGDDIKFSFYVEKNGKLSDFKIIQSVNVNLSIELERILTSDLMPEWEPGFLVGKKKKTLMVYDLKFSLSNELPKVIVSKNYTFSEYTTQTNLLKRFLVAGSVLILATLFITR
jgi:protein TonB